jgi:hypothetical protein
MYVCVCVCVYIYIYYVYIGCKCIVYIVETGSLNMFQRCFNHFNLETASQLCFWLLVPA